MDGQVKVLVAALIQDTMRVLLTKHGPSGKWHLPDTDVRFGETLAQAIERGFREDFGTGLTVLDSKPFGVAQVIDSAIGTHYVIHGLTALPDSWPTERTEGSLLVRTESVEIISAMRGEVLHSSIALIEQAFEIKFSQ